MALKINITAPTNNTYPEAYIKFKEVTKLNYDEKIAHLLFFAWKDEASRFAEGSPKRTIAKFTYVLKGDKFDAYLAHTVFETNETNIWKQVYTVIKSESELDAGDLGPSVDFTTAIDTDEV